MMQFMRILCGLLFAALMTACGGGGGSAGTTNTGGGTGTTAGGTPTLTVSDFALFTDKTQINNSGIDKAQLTVLAVDANRNVVSGAKVVVSTDQNSVFVPAGGDTTDGSGKYVGSVAIGGDKTDRDITISVTVNGITKSTSVHVTGSKLTLTATPGTPSPGQTVTLTATLVDSTSNPIPGAVVTVSGTVPGASGTVTTGLNGQASKAFSAPTAQGVYTISASGNGVLAADYQLQVFTTAVPVAVIPGGAVPSLAASPNVLAVNSAGSTANRSTLRFLFLDATNSPIQNVRVRFSDITTGLPAVGASITSGSQTLFTDTGGSVSAQYIAGQNSSPTNGVTVKACYSATDFTSASDCPASVTASLTVAGQALAVSIGDDNLLGKGSGTYIKRFAITVADSAGRAVANAPVDISVDLTHYGKGLFTAPYVDSSGNTSTFSLSFVPISLTAAYPSLSTDAAATGQRIWCPNEDTNRNGNVDSGENVNGSIDSNNQGTLEPRKSDLLISYDVPDVTTTNSSGILVIKVEYSQRFATWLSYKVRVTANVAGSQGMAERLFVTDFVEGDDKNGSFLDAPYGIHSCLAPN